MPKVPRDRDSATPATPSPKKRTRKAAPASQEVHADSNGNGNGVVAQPVAVPVDVISHQQASSVEERIRVRAYEIYLERGGHGGSPEQDWLRAQQEIQSQ